MRDSPEDESRFEQGTSRARCRPGKCQDFLQVVDVLADFDAAGEKRFGQRAHLVALVEDRLGVRVRRRNPVFGVVSEPKQFGTLQSHQKG